MFYFMDVLNAVSVIVVHAFHPIPNADRKEYSIVIAK